MTDNILIDLPEIRLPRDLAARVKFIEAVDEHLKLLGVNGQFQPPRFFGYYFAGRHPVVLARHWKVTLDAAPLLWRLRQILERMTDSQFSIATESEDAVPDFLLVHDRHDGACWLWGFDQGRRFIESHEPVSTRGVGEDAPVGGERDEEGGSGPRLLGP